MCENVQLKAYIFNSVQKFLMENPRPNLFKKNRPDECWFKVKILFYSYF
jgi:hypothetical protein